MKVSEITKCVCCGKGVAHSGLPIFWVVTTQRMGLDPRAIQRMQGMEMLMGNVMIARAFMDDDVANPLGDKHTVTVCEPCSQKPLSTIWALIPEGAEA